MEPVGLALGVAGLSGLFSACLECFELVQRGRYLGKSYLLLETKFTNQCFRLRTWGRACGFDASGNVDNHKLPVDDEIREGIESTLLNILTLLQDGNGLKKKYGLRRENDAPSGSSSSWSVSIAGTAVSTRQLGAVYLNGKFMDFKNRIQSVQKSTRTVRVMRWAIEDQRKFGDLVQNIKDLIDDLEFFTRETSFRERQKKHIREDIESIKDISVLEAMEEARLGRLDAISDAATLRLWDVRDRLLAMPNTDPPNSDVPSIPQKPSSEDEADWEICTPEQVSSPKLQPSDACYQQLYRVHCTHMDTTCFFDAPSYSARGGDRTEWVVLDETHPSRNSRSLHLTGNRPVRDLQAYVEQNSRIEFIVFQDSWCIHEDNDQGPQAQPGQHIFLCSDSLRSAVDWLLKRIESPGLDESSELKAPYLWYFHFRERLKAEVDVLWQSTSNSLKMLFDFIDSSMRREYETVEAQLRRRAVSWKYLHYVFLPGDIVAPSQDTSVDTSQAYRLVNCRFGGNPGEKECSFVELTAYHLQCDKSLTRVNRTFKIPRNLSYKRGDVISLSSLNVSPISRVFNMALKEYIERGEKFYNLAHGTLVSPGVALVTVNGRHFIIDPIMHEALARAKLHGLDTVAQLKFAAKRHDCDLPRRPLNSEELALLPPMVHGYDLRHHAWQELRVADVQGVTWRENTLRNLAIEEHNLDILCDVSRSIRPSGYPDNTRGKFLLLIDGAPGTNKQRAVDALAEDSNMPIFRISCTSMGTTAREVEASVERILTLAQRWRCLVVMSDADLLLGQRAGFDYAHDTLVTTFLGLLDKYHWPVILTTSRVKVFDEGVRSLIHLQIRFGELTSAGRMQVWNTSLRSTFGEEDIDMDVFENLDKLSESYPLSGNDIRKCVALAKSLEPEFDQVDMKMLESLVRQKLEFFQISDTAVPLSSPTKPDESDPEKEEMKRQIAVMQVEQIKREAEAKQKEIEAKIRKEADESFKKHVAELRIKEEEKRKRDAEAAAVTNQQIADAKKDGERAVMEAFEAKRKADAEAKKKDEIYRAQIEQEVRDRLEAERKADIEARKREAMTRARIERDARDKMEAERKAEEERRKMEAEIVAAARREGFAEH